MNLYPEPAEGTDIESPSRVVDQSHNEGPILNGTIDGPVTAFDNTFRVEGYARVPEGAEKLLDILMTSKV